MSMSRLQIESYAVMDFFRITGPWVVMVGEISGLLKFGVII